MTESPDTPPDKSGGPPSGGLPEAARTFAPSRGSTAEACQVNVSNLRTWAHELGLADVGVAAINDTTLRGERQAREATERWVNANQHAGLRYMEAPRQTPLQLLPTAKTVLVALAATERVAAPKPADPTTGLVAAYARGADYHYVLKDKLWQLVQRLSDALASTLVARVCVDTAPLLERYWAACAGVAFIGKSTMAIAPGIGSRVLLGAALLDCELPSSAVRLDGCGSCTRCLDECPTRAFPEPYVLDANRCISYLTIENQTSIERTLRSELGAHVFGCDVCQAVCPYNASRKLPQALAELQAQPVRQTPALTAWLEMSSGDYRRLTQRSALRRTPRASLQRNAAVALGNANDPSALPALQAALLHNGSALVREHAAWALGQLAHDYPESVRSILHQAYQSETDSRVRDEIEQALQSLGSATPNPSG